MERYKNKELQYAYEMGKSCAENGANLINCHFNIFSSPEKTKAWEEGKIKNTPNP